MWQYLPSDLRELTTKRPPCSFPFKLCLHLCGDILIYEDVRQDAQPSGRAATPKLDQLVKSELKSYKSLIKFEKQLGHD